ncbi:MAG: hypothetical protein OXU45_06350, partial [Candidatus Melainabacteria bacterium]|nr:hypothetical protein [Candidatus Melainabacteria bacterium]
MVYSIGSVYLEKILAHRNEAIKTDIRPNEDEYQRKLKLLFDWIDVALSHRSEVFAKQFRGIEADTVTELYTTNEPSKPAQLEEIIGEVLCIDSLVAPKGWQAKKDDYAADRNKIIALLSQATESLAEKSEPKKDHPSRYWAELNKDLIQIKQGLPEWTSKLNPCADTAKTDEAQETTCHTLEEAEQENHNGEQITSRRDFLGKTFAATAASTSPFWLGCYIMFDRSANHGKAAAAHHRRGKALIEASKFKPPQENKKYQYIEFHDSKKRSVKIDLSPVTYSKGTITPELARIVGSLWRFLSVLKMFITFDKSDKGAAARDNNIADRKELLEQLRMTSEEHSGVEFGNPFEALAYLEEHEELKTIPDIARCLEKLNKEQKAFADFMNQNPYKGFRLNNKNFPHLVAFYSLSGVQVLTDNAIYNVPDHVVELENLFTELERLAQTSSTIGESSNQGQDGLYAEVDDITKLIELKN